MCMFWAIHNHLPQLLLNKSFWNINSVYFPVLSFQALKKQEAKAEENEGEMKNKLRQTESEKSKVRF